MFSRDDIHVLIEQFWEDGFDHLSVLPHCSRPTELVDLCYFLHEFDLGASIISFA